LGSTPIAGATNATYTVTASGSYRVIVTDANGCSDTSAIQSVIPAGINGVYAGNRISILPNPTTGYITVSGAGDVNIKVYNSIGQFLKETNSSHISIAEFPTGLYFVRVFNEAGTLLKQEKVVKY
jgi:hypothetical protein